MFSLATNKYWMWLNIDLEQRYEDFNLMLLRNFSQRIDRHERQEQVDVITNECDIEWLRRKQILVPLQKMD